MNCYSIYRIIFLAIAVSITIAIVFAVKENKKNNDKREQYYEDIHKIAERGMIALARGYIKEMNYTADKPVYEKLKGALAGMEEGNIDRFLEYLDNVMAKCDDREKSDGITGKKEILTQDIA